MGVSSWSVEVWVLLFPGLYKKEVFSFILCWFLSNVDWFFEYSSGFVSWVDCFTNKLFVIDFSCERSSDNEPFLLYQRQFYFILIYFERKALFFKLDVLSDCLESSPSWPVLLSLPTRLILINCFILMYYLALMHFMRSLLLCDGFVLIVCVVLGDGFEVLFGFYVVFQFFDEFEWEFVDIGLSLWYIEHNNNIISEKRVEYHD